MTTTVMATTNDDDDDDGDDDQLDVCRQHYIADVIDHIPLITQHPPIAILVIDPLTHAGY